MEPLFKTKEGEVLVSMDIGCQKSVKTYSVDGSFSRDILASTKYPYLQLVLYEENWFSPNKSLEDFKSCEDKAKSQVSLSQLANKFGVVAEIYTAMGDVSIDIPEEVLVVDLLSKLPLKSLARFKCVSKQWQRLISDTVTMRNDPKLFISFELPYLGLLFDSLDNKTSFESVLSRRELEGMLDEKTYIESSLEEDKLPPVYEFRAHSSFNGFLLIQINNDLIMWNPLTKFFRNVFRGRLILSGYGVTMLDLCFDYANNEYKMLLVNRVDSYSYFSETFSVALCGSNSWEKVDVPDSVKKVYKGTNFNGYNHWICRGGSSPFDELIPHPHHIVCFFDPSTNVFIEIAMPQPKKGQTNTIVGLGVIDGCLCMTRGDDPLSFQGNIEFLLMKEYGNGDSWDVMFVISDIPELRAYDMMEPLFKTKEGEILVYTNIGHYHSLKAYSVDGNFRRDILAPRYYFDHVLYQESLFSPAKNMYMCDGWRTYDISPSVSLQHDVSDIQKAEAVKIKRRRTPDSPYKTSVIATSYESLRDSKFHIPQNLLIEIVSRLPLKCLARLNCVSKQWQHLISNTITTRNDPKLFFSSFLNKHLPIHFYRLLDECLSIHSLDQELRVESLCSPVEKHLLQVCKFRAHSSFNGFLLIQINKDLVMWNPLTKYFRKVFHGRHTSLYCNYSSMVDLCFDYVNNEYKMLLVDKIASYSFSAENFYVAPCGASSWEKVNVPDTVKKVHKGPSFNGYKHWISKGCFSPFRESNPPCPRNHIVYFDPSTNEFIEIATPQPKKGDTDTIVGLGVLDGCLCMARWDDPLSFQGNVEFLLMKEYKNGDSWDIMFIISNIPQLGAYDTMQPLFKTKEGEVLVYTSIGDARIVKTDDEYGDDQFVKAYDEYGNFRRDILVWPHDCSNLVLYEESWFFPTV